MKNNVLTYAYKSHNDFPKTLQYNRPTKCPCCGAGVPNAPVYAGHFTDRYQELKLLFTVTECNACQWPFVSIYAKEKSTNIFNIIQEHPKTEADPTEFSSFIKATFPDFVSFYHQSEKAEHSGLKDICGVGYRKALEFLVKTYLIDVKKFDAKIIESTSLGNCISKIDNEPVKACARNAARLGNDQTHYKQKYQNKDISDLKTLIEIVVLWLNLEHKAQEQL